MTHIDDQFADQVVRAFFSMPQALASDQEFFNKCDGLQHQQKLAKFGAWVLQVICDHQNVGVNPRVFCYEEHAFRKIAQQAFDDDCIAIDETGAFQPVMHG